MTNLEAINLADQKIDSNPNAKIDKILSSSLGKYSEYAPSLKVYYLKNIKEYKTYGDISSQLELDKANMDIILQKGGKNTLDFVMAKAGPVEMQSIWDDTLISFDGDISGENLGSACNVLSKIYGTNFYPSWQQNYITRLNKFFSQKAASYGLNFSYQKGEKYQKLIKSLAGSFNDDIRTQLFEYSNTNEKVGDEKQKALAIYSNKYGLSRQDYVRFFDNFLVYKNSKDSYGAWKELINSEFFDIFLSSRLKDKNYKKGKIGNTTFENMSNLSNGEIKNIFLQLDVIKSAWGQKNFKDVFNYFYQSDSYSVGYDRLAHMARFVKNQYPNFSSIYDKVKANDLGLGNLSKVELAMILSRDLQNPTLQQLQDKILQFQESLKNYNFPILSSTRETMFLYSQGEGFAPNQGGKNMLQNAKIVGPNDYNFGSLQNFFLSQKPINLVLNLHGLEHKFVISISPWVELKVEDLVKLFIFRQKNLGIKNDVLITASCYGVDIVQNFVSAWKKLDPSCKNMPAILCQNEQTQVGFQDSDEKNFENRFLNHVFSTNNVSKVIFYEWNKTNPIDDSNFSYFLPTKNGLDQVADTKTMDLPAQA